MENTYWHKQTVDKPLFPDLLWSRPENKRLAGKLLIVGGNAHGFGAAATAYGVALQAGAGTVRVLLPDSLQKTVGRVFEAGEYAPSTPSGSFSQKALAELIELAGWADGVIIAGDLGRNSETAVLLEKFIEKYEGQLTVTQDALDYFAKLPAPLLGRPSTTLALGFAQLQKIAAGAGFTTAFTFDMDFLRLVDALHEFSAGNRANFMLKHHKNSFVAVNGEVSTTSRDNGPEGWPVPAAARASVWWLQNPNKTFEALTTSLV